MLRLSSNVFFKVQYPLFTLCLLSNCLSVFHEIVLGLQHCKGKVNSCKKSILGYSYFELSKLVNVTAICNMSSIIAGISYMPLGHDRYFPGEGQDALGCPLVVLSRCVYVFLLCPVKIVSPKSAQHASHMPHLFAFILFLFNVLFSLFKRDCSGANFKALTKLMVLHLLTRLFENEPKQK